MSGSLMSSNDTMIPDLEVSEQFVKDGKIILNICKFPTMGRLRRLRIGNDTVKFDARFPRITHHLLFSHFRNSCGMFNE